MIKGSMRKLAREAIIFALVGLLVATIGIFVKLDTYDRAAAREKAAEAFHGSIVTQIQVAIDFSIRPHAPSVTHAVPVPLRNGTVLLVPQRPIDLTAGLVPKGFFQ
jgi:hypothetical protein